MKLFKIPGYKPEWLLTKDDTDAGVTGLWTPNSKTLDGDTIDKDGKLYLTEYHSLFGHDQDAIEYEIYDNEDMDVKLNTDIIYTLDNYFNIPPTLRPNHKYYWRARYINKANQKSDWSDLRSFYTSSNITSGDVIIYYPMNTYSGNIIYDTSGNDTHAFARNYIPFDGYIKCNGEIRSNSYNVVGKNEHTFLIKYEVYGNNKHIFGFYSGNNKYAFKIYNTNLEMYKNGSNIYTFDNFDFSGNREFTICINSSTRKTKLIYESGAIYEYTNNAFNIGTPYKTFVGCADTSSNNWSVEIKPFQGDVYGFLQLTETLTLSQYLFYKEYL